VSAVGMPVRVGRPRIALPGRLLRMELRHNTMLWILPLVALLFWIDTYHRTMQFASAPLWGLRTYYVQEGGILGDCAPFAIGVAAWTGSRDGRRRTSELVATAARSSWSRLLAGWLGATCWALLAYLGCIGVIYGTTASQAHWGGPLWWPVIVGAFGMLACCALGFAAGTLVPSRFTAPVAAIAGYLVLLIGRGIGGYTSTYAQVLPTRTGFDINPESGQFYPYLPDVSITQVMLLGGLTLAVLGGLGVSRAAGSRMLRLAATLLAVAGLTAAGTGVALAGTAKPGPYGVTISALHDAANDRPVRYTPVCQNTDGIPLCVQPAYGPYVGDMVAALSPILEQFAGLPGAPVGVTQQATPMTGQGDMFQLTTVGGRPQVSMTLGGMVPGAFGNTAASFREILRDNAFPVFAATLVGTGSDAQRAVTVGIGDAIGLPLKPGSDAGRVLSDLALAPSSPAGRAAARFAALPAATRLAWLTAHLTALRAGQITLAEMP
jgi:hypothetical protein